MNDEIKQIIEDIKLTLDVTVKDMVLLNRKDIKQLLDYITDLQKENERLKEIVENLTTMTVCGDRKQIKNTAQYKLDICKSRNEKAIKRCDYLLDNDLVDINGRPYVKTYSDDVVINYIKSALEGVDKE